jgi:hypothetical protein
VGFSLLVGWGEIPFIWSAHRLVRRKQSTGGWGGQQPVGLETVPSVCADFPYPAVRARAFPAGPPACRPSRLSLLSGAARSVSLAQTRAPAGFSPAKAARSAAALPMRAPAKSGASDVVTGAEKQSEIAHETRVRARDDFFQVPRTPRL